MSDSIRPKEIAKRIREAKEKSKRADVSEPYDTDRILGILKNNDLKASQCDYCKNYDICKFKLTTESLIEKLKDEYAYLTIDVSCKYYLKN